MPDDYYVSQYSGEEIDERLTAAHNAVRYDAAQTLTDAQKKQAKRNIAAAPDGFGLGGSATLLTPADNLDTLMKNGWFQFDKNNPPQGTIPTALDPYAILVRVSSAGNTCVQEVYDTTDSEFHSIVLRRTVYGVGPGAKIYPWEWVNPFMQLGVEYRTTERYLGRPVYCKLVDFGKLPNNAVKEVSHGISNLQYAISVAGESNGDNLIGNMYITYVHVSPTNIRIETNADRSGVSATVLIKYTKTTD